MNSVDRIDRTELQEFYYCERCLVQVYFTNLEELGNCKFCTHTVFVKSRFPTEIVDRV